MLPIRVETKLEFVFVKGIQRQTRSATFMGSGIEAVSGFVNQYVTAVEDSGWMLVESKVLWIKNKEAQDVDSGIVSSGNTGGGRI